MLRLSALFWVLYYTWYTVKHPLWQVINRSARYKNRYVHRRDSLSLANITLEEKEKLAKIGKNRPININVHIYIYIYIY